MILTATAAHLDLPDSTPGLAEACDAAVEWGLKRRCLTPADVLYASPDWVRGVVLYAALNYQKRAMPQGFPGFDPDVASVDMGASMADIYRLVGLDPVVA